MFTNVLSPVVKLPAILNVGHDSYKLCPSITKFFLVSDNFERTEIHYAAMNGCLDNLHRSIIFENFYLDQLDCFDRSAMHYASINGDVKAIQILLANGANPNIADMHEYTPMHYAAEAGYASAVLELIKTGGKVCVQTRGSATPLHLAVLNGHLKTAELLIANGADVNHADSGGGTALHFASLMGYLPLVKMLLDKNAKVNSMTLSDKTPLTYAENFKEIKDLLLSHGAISERGIPDSTDPVYLASLPLPDKDYGEEAKMLGDIYSYFIDL